MGSTKKTKHQYKWHVPLCIITKEVCSYAEDCRECETAKNAVKDGEGRLVFALYDSTDYTYECKFFEKREENASP